MTDKELLTLLDERQGAANIRDELQTRVDEIGGVIKAELGARGIRGVDLGPWRAQVVTQRRVTISKQKLLSAGVTAAQIEASTEETTYETFRVGSRPVLVKAG